jgi:hypothetical protein
MTTGRKGMIGAAVHNKKWTIIKSGKASPYLPTYSIEEAIRKAGLWEHTK